MEITVVYVDVLVFTNTLISYCILQTVAGLLHLKTRLFRLIPASFLSSLSALCVYLPFYTGILSFLIKTAVCALTVLVAFFCGNPRGYLKSFLLTVGVSLLYSGFFIAVYELFKPPNMAIINDIVYFEFSPILMIGLSVIIYLIVILVRRILSKRITETVVGLRFTVKGRSYECTGKIDTGCDAVEPFSEAPVIIADKSVFDAEQSENKRVIPYRTLSGASLMYAVRSDEVYINHEKIQKIIYIASADIAEEGFQAIINSGIVR